MLEEDDLDEQESPAKVSNGDADRIAAKLAWWRWLESERAKHPNLTTDQFDALMATERETMWIDLGCGGGGKSKSPSTVDWQTAPPPKRKPGRPRSKLPKMYACQGCESRLPHDAFPRGKRRSRFCLMCTAERTRRVLEAHAQGLSFAKMSKVLGIKVPTCHAIWREAVGEHTAAT